MAINRIRERGMQPILTAIVVVLLGAVAGCSGATKAPGPRASTAGAPGVATAASGWDTVVGRVGADGRLDLPMSLAAFALAVGPIPGVPAPAGPSGPIPSGTLAVHSVFARWAQLTAAQRGAVRAGLAITGDHPAAYRPVRAIPPAADPDVPCRSADSAGAAPYRSLMAGIETELTGRLGRPLTVSDRVFLSVNTKDLEHAMLYTYGCAGAQVGTGRISGCTIHINPSTIAAAHFEAEVRSFLVHELTHCYLYDRYGMAYDRMPAWYVEGVPTYAMVDLGASSTRLGGIWQNYLDHPTRPLAARSYDGVGFFVHLAETGTNPWSRVDAIGSAMLGRGAGATAAGWAAAGPSAAFVNTWGGGFVQGRYPGTAWTSTGSHLPAYRPALPDGRVGNGGSLTVGAPAYAAAVRHLDVDAEVVVATAGPGDSGRITVGAGADAALDAGPFCTRTGCACPVGSARAGTSFTAMAAGDTYLGLSGGAGAALVTLAGSTLSDFCAKPSTPCLVGRWTTVAFDVAAGKVAEHGGAGATLHIDARGKSTVVFNGMSPISFSTTMSGRTTAGRFTFAGSMWGSVQLPPAGVTSGPWQQVGAGGAGGITADVQITKPISYHLGPINVAALASAVAGGASVGRPQLTAGTWSCTGDTLVSTPPRNGSVRGTWTLHRTGPA